MKIAIITCYDQNNYVRAQTLRTAFTAAHNTEVIILKNKHKSLRRYPEMYWRVLWLRLRQRPDAYVITFRGYEMLPWVLLICGRKPVIFDELVNAIEYLQEHNRINLRSLQGRLFARWYGWLIRRCRFVLADTQAHAELSAGLSRANVKRFRVLPIGLEEELFHPRIAPRQAPPHKPFTVFYYGNGMTPLHGLHYILEAALLLKDNPDITFSIFGGRKTAAGPCAEAIAQGAHLAYEPWVPHEQIARHAIEAGLCLGGPFGKTLQSQYVITGKSVQFMACAAPVLIGRNQVTSIFKDKQNCLLVPQADARAVCQAITWAAAHPAELKRIGEAGRKTYEQYFSQHIINGIVQNIVQEL